MEITASCAAAIAAVFDQAERRDPGHARPWIALVDGDRHQIEVIRGQAAARGITVTILVDFIHVLEYLWKAAWCFCPPRDPAAEDWVAAQALDILHGRVPEVITRIEALTAADPPKPGSEHAKIIRTTLAYLAAKQPWMDYPRALAEGWPIATGVIEGACRHLPGPGPDGHHRRQMGPARRPGDLVAPRHPRQRRPARLLGLAHHPGTPPQPPQPLPRQPRTSRMTLTAEKPHPCHFRPGIRAVLRNVQTPRMNAIAERWIGGCRRELARGIHPAVLAKGGLRFALRTLARRCPIPVDLQVHAKERLPEPVEVSAYYVVAEALTNAARHAHASAVGVEAEIVGDLLRVTVRDNGVGGASLAGGSGLAGLKDRVEALGGRIVLHSPPGAGSSLRAELPLTATNDGVTSR